jgi:hypothetical protein
MVGKAKWRATRQRRTPFGLIHEVVKTIGGSRLVAAAIADTYGRTALSYQTECSSSGRRDLYGWHWGQSILLRCISLMVRFP